MKPRKHGSVVSFVFATALILIILAVVLVPWLGQHSGKSTQLSGLSRKLRPLIQRYKKDTGVWPRSWPQIVKAYQPDPTYDYEFICKNHFWRHTESGSLDGLRLQLAEETAEYASFRVWRPGSKNDFPLLVPK